LSEKVNRSPGVSLVQTELGLAWSWPPVNKEFSGLRRRGGEEEEEEDGGKSRALSCIDLGIKS